MDQDRDDDGFVKEDAPLSHRLTRAIKRAIFGGGDDVNLPDENPNKDNPSVKARREREHAQRQGTQTLDKLQKFGRKMSEGAAGEKIRSLKQKGMSELEATRKALGQDDDE